MLSSWFRSKETTNIYTFDHLRNLYKTLKLNRTVTRENHGLVIETLRSISELVVRRSRQLSDRIGSRRIIHVYVNKHLLQYTGVRRQTFGILFRVFLWEEYAFDVQRDHETGIKISRTEQSQSSSHTDNFHIGTERQDWYVFVLSHV